MKRFFSKPRMKSKSVFALKCAVVFLSFILLAVAFRLSTISTSAQENGASSSATLAETGNVCQTDNADIMMVIDTSNSMEGANIQSAKKAATDLVNIVSKNPKMRVGVASFDNHGRLNQGLSSSPSTVIGSINNMKTGGKNGTCLECALRQKGNSDVQTAFTNAGQNGNKRHVIILTDGKINFYQKSDGTDTGQPNDKSEEKKARDQALGAIADISQNQGVAFWFVQYGGQDNKAWIDSIISSYNGQGKYFYAPNLANVDVIYKQIANELSGGTLTAFVYDDINKNGKYDEPDEKPLANVEVTMTDQNGSKTQKTGPDGKTSFKQLCGTAYKLKVAPPDPYQPSPPGSNEKDVTVPLGNEKTENFGMTKDTEITFNFQFVLHGIGIAGDQVVLRPYPCQSRSQTASNSATPGTSANGCYSNQNPVHPTRNILIEMLDASGSAVASLSSTMTYDSQIGFFKGIGKITTSVKAGAYTFRAKTPMFLRRKLAFTQPIKPGETYTLPPTDLIAADVDNDNQLSILDYNLILACYNYPGRQAKCEQPKIDSVDTDDNGVLNEFDINLFLRELSERIGE